MKHGIMKSWAAAWVLMAAFFVASGAFAQTEEGSDAEAGASSDDESPFQTVVTPSRTGGTTFDTDRSIYVVDDERIRETMPIDLPEAIDEIPGVQVQRTNRGAGAPILRGLIGPQNLLLIDGLRFTQSTFRTGPHQYLSLIDPTAVDGVEVLLGPGSVLYGANAVGGVVNAIPRSVMDEEGLEGFAVGRFASADLAQEGTLHFGGSKGPFSGWAGGSIRNHEELRTGGGDTVPVSDYLQGDWRARVGFDLGHDWTLDAFYLASIIQDGGRVDQLGRGQIRLYDNMDHFVAAQAFYRPDNSWLKEFRVSAVYHRSEERVLRRECEVDDDGSVVDRRACENNVDDVITRRRDNEDIVNTVGGLVQAKGSWLDDRLSATVGVEAYADFVQSTRDDARPPGFEFEARDRGNFSDGSEYFTVGAYTYLEGRPVQIPNHELILTGGVRFEYLQAHAPDVPDLGTVDYDATGLVGTAGIRYLLMNRYNFYANFSQGFRPPNLQESTVLGDTGTSFEVPNDELDPERSNTVEVGMKLFTPWLDISGAFFWTQIDDVISRGTVGDEPVCDVAEGEVNDGVCTVGGKPVVRRINADKATYIGTEVGFASRPKLGFSTFANLMYLEGEIEHADGSTEKARRVPPLQGRAGVRWAGLTDEALKIEWYMLFAAEQNDLSPGDKTDLRMCERDRTPGTVDPNCDAFPGWFTMGVRARYDFAERVSTTLNIDNIMDQPYRVFGSGFDAPGINIRLGVRVDL